jgi:hypothetical protein
MIIKWRLSYKRHIFWLHHNIRTKKEVAFKIITPINHQKNMSIRLFLLRIRQYFTNAGFGTYMRNEFAL